MDPHQQDPQRLPRRPFLHRVLVMVFVWHSLDHYKYVCIYIERERDKGWMLLILINSRLLHSISMHELQLSVKQGMHTTQEDSCIQFRGWKPERITFALVIWDMSIGLSSVQIRTSEKILPSRFEGLST